MKDGHTVSLKNPRRQTLCLIKSISFGFVITLISCSCGMEARDGAKGVGIATTKAVVWSFVAIVILDLIFAAMFFY